MDFEIHVGQFLEQLGQIGIWLRAIDLTGLDDIVDCGTDICFFGRSTELPVLPSYCLFQAAGIHPYEEFAGVLPIFLAHGDQGTAATLADPFFFRESIQLFFVRGFFIDSAQSRFCFLRCLWVGTSIRTAVPVL